MPALILVIDDDEPILGLYESLLGDDGHRVLLSRHIYEDPASVERISPDVIILDCLFGRDANGVGMLGALKRHPATASIPIVLCSAASGAILEAVEPYLNDPRVRLIQKPFQIDELSAAVFQMLALKTGSRTLDPQSGCSAVTMEAMIDTCN
jgi:DNA-binding NtrC family response regulator